VTTIAALKKRLHAAQLRVDALRIEIARMQRLEVEARKAKVRDRRAARAAETAQLRRAGLTWREIGERLGVDHHALYVDVWRGTHRFRP